MKERPILFSAPMVRAILEGRKTQTRRAMNPQPMESFATDYNDDGSVKERRSYGWSWQKGTMWPHVDIFPGGESLFRQFCPYGAVGDRLWVKETSAIVSIEGSTVSVARRERMPVGKTLAQTDGGLELFRLEGEQLEQARRLKDDERWRPSIHMPRWASRITLEVTGVRVERLQDISCADAIAEGCAAVSLHDLNCDSPDPRDEYKALWESINGAESWEANPFVWVISFRRVP